MKLNGNVIEARYEMKIEFNRSPEPPIVFTLQSFSDTEKLFNSLCPRPEPGYIQKPGGGIPEVDTESVSYIEALNEWYGKDVQFMILNSITDVEWDTVVLDDPSTWENWKDDMLKAGFASGEVTKLHNMIFVVNGLSDDSLKEAEKN